MLCKEVAFLYLTIIIFKTLKLLEGNDEKIINNVYKYI